MADAPLPNAEGQNPEGNVRFARPDNPLTVEIVPMNFKVYQVSEDGIERLSSGTTSLNMLFFGVCFGALISFASVLFSTPIQNPKTFAAFVALTVLFLLGSAVFGVNGYRDYRAIKERVRDIKTGICR